MTTQRQAWIAGRNALAGAILMAAVSTIGDAIWFEKRLPHRVAYGLTHGTLFCAAIGAYLGGMARRPMAGAAGGAAIGLAAAAGYYLLAPLTGAAIMFVVWMALWAAVAALHEWLQRGSVSLRDAAIRAPIAAVASGIMFYAISDIWTGGGARNYAFHFASWTLPYLAAFLVLLVPGPGFKLQD